MSQKVRRCEGCITAIKFNETGSIFAYATGYDWSKGHQHRTPTYLNKDMLHIIKDECKLWGKKRGGTHDS
jgi:hypothetical protein